MSLRFHNSRIDWREARLKDCFSYGKGLNITKADLVEDGTPVISYGQIHAKQNDGTHLKGELLRYVPDEVARENPGARLKVGDIVFADTSEDLAGVGNCVLNDVGDGVYAGYHTLIARAKDPRNSKYLSYLFQTDCWREQLRKRACGIKVFSLTQRLLSNVRIVLPPGPEQERIAAFLDEKCATVDKAIEIKRKQLESIEAIWKNLLYRATTQGLSAQTRMVASGNVLFPRIPAGWKVVRIKNIGTLRYGLGEPPETSDDGIPMIRATDFRAGKIDDRKMIRINPADLPEGRNAFLRTGEIIVVRSGAYAGDSTIIPAKYNGYISGYDMVVTITKAVPEFIAYAFLSKHILDDQLLLLSLRAAQPHVNAEQVLNLGLPLPPKEEQKKIAVYLSRKRDYLDSLAANLRKQIETLEQYRKSLIHEYVTGERRVV